MLKVSRAIGCGFGIALAGVVGYVPLLASPLPQGASPQAPRPQLASPRPASSRAVPSTVSPGRALLDQYCVTCHNERRRTADLTLDTTDVDHVGVDAEVWERVVGKLRSGAMPPPGIPRPDKATYDKFAAELAAALDRAAAGHPNPGRPVVHRLNRLEYTNAIRDLLALEIDPRSMLPTDESGYGFDNIADVLSVSPALLERYLLAAQKISRLAVGDSAMRPVVETVRIARGLVQDDRMSDDVPCGAGQIKGGRHLRLPTDTPLANLHVTLLDKMGIPEEHLGDSTGKLELLSDV